MATSPLARGAATAVNLMKITFWGRLAIGLTALAMGGAFLTLGQWEAAIGVALLAALWAWSQLWGSQGLNNALFAAFLAVATSAVVRGVMPGAMLVGSLGALAAWDLGALKDRLDRAAHATATERLHARHVERLVTALGLGGALGGVALVGSLSLSLGTALGLGVIAIVGLRWLLRTMAQNLN